MADDVDSSGSGVPDGWHPDGLLAGLPAMNAAAGGSTLGAVMTPEQIADVDWGDGESANNSGSHEPNSAVARAYDGVCQLPDGSLHPYTDTGGGYGLIYGGGNANSNGQGGIGEAANGTTSPTVPKPGGIGGGGKSGPWTSPASTAARALTGNARLNGLESLTGTASVGGSIDRAIPLLGGALMLYDFYQHDTAPSCTPVRQNMRPMP